MSLFLFSLWILHPIWWRFHLAWKPTVRLNWPADIFHHLDSRPMEQKNKHYCSLKIIMVRSWLGKKVNIWQSREIYLRASSLPFDAVPGARETKLVMRNGWTLDEMCVFQTLLAQRTLQRGCICGRSSRRCISQRYRRGWHERDRGRAVVHRGTTGHIRSTTGRNGRIHQTSNRTIGVTTTVTRAGTTSVSTARATWCTGGGYAATISLARRYCCRADVSATGWSTSAGRTAYKTRLVKKKKKKNTTANQLLSSKRMRNEKKHARNNIIYNNKLCFVIFVIL